MGFQKPFFPKTAERGDVGVRLMILVDFMACQTLNLSDYVLMYVLLKLTDVVDMFPIIGTIMELPK